MAEIEERLRERTGHTVPRLANAPGDGPCHGVVISGYTAADGYPLQPLARNPWVRASLLATQRGVLP